MYKSTDGGASWLDTGPDHLAVWLHTVAVSPSDSSVVYAGGADQNYLTQVYKSTNGGASWVPVGIRYDRVVVSLAVHPLDSDIVMAGTWRGLYKTADGGLSWRRVWVGNMAKVNEIAIDPSNPSIMYHAAAGGNGGLYRSTDEGETWTKTSLPSDVATTVAIDRNNTSVLYAGLGWLGFPSIYKSTDSGDNWVGASGISGWVNSIVVNPVDSTKLYAGMSYSGGVKFSDDSGDNFSSLNDGLGWKSVFDIAIHEDNPDMPYAAATDGIYVHTPCSTGSLGVNPPFIYPGDSFAYEITVTNCEGVQDPNVVVVDELPDGVQYQFSHGEPLLDYEPEVNGNTLTFNLGPLGPGESREIEVHALATGPAGAPLSNKVIINPDKPSRRELHVDGPTILGAVDDDGIAAEISEEPPEGPDEWDPVSAQSKGPSEIRIATFNITGRREQCIDATHSRLGDIKRLIKKARPDVIVLQEVTGANAYNIWSKLKGRYPYSRYGKNSVTILGWVPVQVTLKDAFTEKPYGTGGHGANSIKLLKRKSSWHGLMILSRYPIKSSFHKRLTRLEYNPLNSSSRSVLRARIGIGDTDIIVFNTHLATSGGNKLQAAEIVNYSQNPKFDGYKKIVAGDLNSGPEGHAASPAAYNYFKSYGFKEVIDAWRLTYRNWTHRTHKLTGEVTVQTAKKWLDHIMNKGLMRRRGTTYDWPYFLTDTGYMWNQIPNPLSLHWYRYTCPSDHRPLLSVYKRSFSSSGSSSTQTTLAPGEESTQTATVSSEAAQATFSIDWAGSNVGLTLLRPDGTEITSETDERRIYHEKDETHELYLIDNPLAGEWQLRLRAIEVPPEGEPVNIEVSEATHDPLDVSPPETKLIVPLPDGDNGWYRFPQVTELLATDDHPNSTGVMTTRFWLNDSDEAVYGSPISVSEGRNVLSFFSIDTMGNSEVTNEHLLNVDMTPPSAPSLSGSLLGPGQIELSWGESTDEVSGVSGYRIFDAVSNELLQETTETSFVFSNLAGGTYRYNVAAFDEAGNLSEPSNLVTIQTNQPPTADAGGPYAQDEGSTVSFEGSGSTDPDGDTLQYRWDFEDDAAWDTDWLSDPTAENTWNDDYSGTARLEVSDGAIESQDTAAVTINNVSPIVDAGPDIVVDEGEPIDLSGSFTDPGVLDTHTVEWDFGNSEFSVGSLTPTHIYRDDGVYGVTLTVTDDDGGVGQDTLQVEVINVDPEVGEVTVPVDPVAVDNAISASAPFTDEGILDAHTALWSWGDGTTSVGTVSEDLGVGSVTGSHAYANAGVFTVELTVTDDDDGMGTASSQEYVVIYDLEGGFVTGGGWIDSPEGAYPEEPGLTGKANFGFVSKYKNGASIPTGNTEFQFKVADLNFKSTSYDWLVIAGARAQYKGEGTINGLGNFGFMLTAIDGAVPGGGGEDRFRIKIWDKDLDDAIVYDNQRDSEDFDDPIATTLGGGSIVVHNK